jgi:hypothetical protein
MTYEDAVGVLFIFVVLSFSNKHALLCFGILVLMLLGLYSIPPKETFDSATPSENHGQTTILLCLVLLILMFLKRVI